MPKKQTVRMPGYRRYQIYSNGTVRNIATDKFLTASKQTVSDLQYQLTGDNGVRKTVNLTDIKAAYKKHMIRARVGAKKAEEVKPAMRTGQKFNYEIAVAMRKKVDALGGPSKVKWREIAADYGVNADTVRCIYNGKRFTTPPATA